MNYQTNVDASRRIIALKELQFYNYQQLYHTALSLKSIFKNNDMKSWTVTAPITEKIINDISLLFQQKPLISINSLKAQLTLLLQLLQLANFYNMLVTVNRLVNLTGKVGVLTRMYELELVFDIITPDACIVICELNFPTKVKEVMYYQHAVSNTSYRLPLLKYIRITKETISTVEINQLGNVYKEYNVEANPYGYIPITWFTNTFDTDYFFKLTINPIVRYNLYYNIAKSYQNLALAYQSVATMISIGMDKDFKIPFGPQNFINIPIDAVTYNAQGPQYDIKYINPQTNFDALYKYSLDIENQLASYAGINAESYKNSTNYSSGWHFELSRQDIINSNIMQQPFYATSIKKLINQTCDTVNIYSEEYQLPENPSVTVDFAELSVKSNPTEQWAIWLKELEHNIKTVKDIMKEMNKDLTDKQIEKIIQLNTSYNNTNGVDLLKASDNYSNTGIIDETLSILDNKSTE